MKLIKKLIPFLAVFWLIFYFIRTSDQYNIRILLANIDGVPWLYAVVGTIFGADQINPHDVLAINSASAALMLSGIPFEGPIGAVRVAYSTDGQWIPHPTFEEGEESTFELVVAGRALDRALGAAFGVVRGLAVIGIAYLIFSAIIPIPSQPGWMSVENPACALCDSPGESCAASLI